MYNINFVLCFQNRPTGDCYVQMSTVEAASKAADRLHRRNMGRRYIEVFQVRRGGEREGEGDGGKKGGEGKRKAE